MRPASALMPGRMMMTVHASRQKVHLDDFDLPDDVYRGVMCRKSAIHVARFEESAHIRDRSTCSRPAHILVRMFSVADRNRIHERVLAMAAADPRIVAGAVVGSLALAEGDRWSDLDLTFAVVDEVPVGQVLEEWTRAILAEMDAEHLFDAPSGASIYRVFLLPGCLQFDLSFTPASRFGARGPKFRLLFGDVGDAPHTEPPTTAELFGHAAHHLLRARFCLERRRFWHAEFWISGARDAALALACRRRGLSPFHGRGFDDLPAELLARFEDTLIRSLDADEQLRALGRVLDELLREAHEAGELGGKAGPWLRELTIPWDE